MDEYTKSELQNMLRALFWISALVLAGFSIVAVVMALQGDELGGSAALVLGVVAVLVFALTKPAAWLIGKIIEWIVVLLRRLSALIPWSRIPLPRVRLPEWVKRGASGVLAVLTMDWAALLALMFVGRGHRGGDSEQQWLPAESLAESHMRANGFPDAQLTAPRRTEGADVVAGAAVARVATRTEPVDTPMVRRLGDTHPELPFHRFYSTSGFTRIAVVTADKIGVALLNIDESGTVVPVNEVARRPV